MKTRWIVCAAGLMGLFLNGCRCGCLEGSSLPEQNVEAAYWENRAPSYPILSTEMEVQASYGQSF